MFEGMFLRPDTEDCQVPSQQIMRRFEAMGRLVLTKLVCWESPVWEELPKLESSWGVEDMVLIELIVINDVNSRVRSLRNQRQAAHHDIHTPLFHRRILSLLGCSN